MSRCSTPDFSDNRRFQYPEEYPCYNLDGIYMYEPKLGCLEKCCIVSRCTPDGDDTPKWVATLAARKEVTTPKARQEGASPTAQPLFGPPETPPKTVLPEDYNPETGNTPLHGEGWQMTHARVNCDRPGVPGHSVDHPFCLATPTRKA